MSLFTAEHYHLLHTRCLLVRDTNNLNRRCTSVLLGVCRSEMKGSRATLESTGKANSDEGGSLNEYAADVDLGKFNEEGSFAGEYAANTSN